MLPSPAPMLWTLDDYHQLIDTGLLAGRRVQLIEGELIEMPPMNTPHIGAMNAVYVAAGAREVWLVDLVAEQINVWRAGTHSISRDPSCLEPALEPPVTIEVAAVFEAARQP